MAKDKHISVQPGTHDRLKALADKEKRSMRSMLEILIEAEEKRED